MLRWPLGGRGSGVTSSHEVHRFFIRLRHARIARRPANQPTEQVAYGPVKTRMHCLSISNRSRRRNGTSRIGHWPALYWKMVPDGPCLFLHPVHCGQAVRPVCILYLRAAELPASTSNGMPCRIASSIDLPPSLLYSSARWCQSMLTRSAALYLAVSNRSFSSSSISSGSGSTWLFARSPPALRRTQTAHSAIHSLAVCLPHRTLTISSLLHCNTSSPRRDTRSI
jgi:hypothetical protein